jgi:hypothetical protein
VEVETEDNKGNKETPSQLSKLPAKYTIDPGNVSTCGLVCFVVEALVASFVG